MSGQLDENSRVIGRLEAAVENLTRDSQLRTRVQDERHQENIDALNAINRNVGEVKGDVAQVKSEVKSLKTAVSIMQPVVDGVRVTRWKMAGAMSLGAAILMALGWVALKLAELAIGALITKFWH